MRKFLLPLSLLLAFTSSVHAAENTMRPGLWEMSATSDLLSLAEQIPPDQMQNLSNLAKQYGFDMPKIQNGAATSKVCITKEMAEQKIPPYLYHRQSGCEARNAIRVENRYTADLACSGNQINGQGKTEATLTTSESFTGRTEFKGQVRGIPVDESANTSGRWLGQSCPATKTGN
ncbi:DUF3617 domain-containing protein [Herminiimonas arsenitoxidans]|uniref:DUF3617 domain-containing protein n=1 Tax=Herminiimonas arsenitoxidans TaxID=1809410 RepID=UPI00097025A5|nr:DUF3617 domain-containing protein [Herminiimonas arsenitoxidans]